MIEASRDEFPVSLMCEALEVSRSGFYAWSLRPESKRSKENKELALEIEEVHRKSRKTYGSPRVHAELKAEGRRIGRKRVARIMRENGLRARGKRRFRKTTDSTHNCPISPNLLNRRFVAEAPNKVWVGDITYLWTAKGWLYLAVILDLFSRKVVGWALADNMRTDLVLVALKEALLKRRPEQGLVHHTDRGSQYASGDYQAVLKAHGFEGSMSRKGDCWDNAVAESFFGSLKTELEGIGDWKSEAEARVAVFDYLEVFYNGQRRHSSLGYLSPAEFELKAEGTQFSTSGGEAA